MTVQIHNPKTLLPITLTDAACEHVEAALSQDKLATAFRLSVKEAGCSGLQYVVELVSESKSDDYCFETNANFKLYVDKESYPYVKGTEIDYGKEGVNEMFRYNNPNEVGGCGCGESFVVEDKS